MTRLPPLTPDDPLRASTPSAAAPPPAAEPAASSTPRTEIAPDPPPEPPTQPLAAAGRRDWSGASDVATFRLPAEILHELDDRARRLRLTKGTTIAAALQELFARGDRELIELVDAAQQRYDSARRRAKRAA